VDTGHRQKDNIKLDHEGIAYGVGRVQKRAFVKKLKLMFSQRQGIYRPIKRSSSKGPFSVGVFQQHKV
jgi:hypothetical protein